MLKRIPADSQEFAPHLAALRTIRRLREKRRDRPAVERQPASPPPPVEDLEDWEMESIDWDAMDAPSEPKRPLDLVLISALPGPGFDLLADKLRRLGLGLTMENCGEAEVLSFDRAPDASERRITRLPARLLPRLPGLHHYHLLFVMQAPESVGTVIENRAKVFGLAREELRYLLGRHQKGLVQRLRQASHIDLLVLDDSEIADDARLERAIIDFLGTKRIETLRNGNPG